MRNTVSDKFRTVYFQLPADTYDGYKYNLTFAPCKGANGNLLTAMLNGQTLKDSVPFPVNADAEVSLPYAQLLPYPQTNSVALKVSGSYATLDYMRLEPVKVRSVGLMLLFR